MSADEPVALQYTVKELLAVQNDKLDRIERKVDEAAIRQAEQMGKMEHRVTVLELRPTNDDHEKRLRSLERFRYAVPSSALLCAAATVGTFVYFLFH